MAQNTQAKRPSLLALCWATCAALSCAPQPAMESPAPDAMDSAGQPLTTPEPDPASAEPAQATPEPAPPKRAAATRKPPARSFVECESGDPVTGPVKRLQDIDWCNVDFPDGWTALRRGEHEVHEYMEMGGMHDTYLHSLSAIAFGDVSGEGPDEVVLLLREENYYTSGSSSSGASMYLFELKQGQAVLKAQEFANAADVMSVKIEGDTVLQVADTHTRGQCTLRWRPYAKTPQDRGSLSGTVESSCVPKKP